MYLNLERLLGFSVLILITIFTHITPTYSVSFTSTHLTAVVKLFDDVSPKRPVFAAEQQTHYSEDSQTQNQGEEENAKEGLKVPVARHTLCGNKERKIQIKSNTHDKLLDKAFSLQCF